MIVEDDPDFADLLSALLPREGLMTAIAYDGRQALEEAQMRRPDLVTLDIRLPRKSGIMLYRQMRH